MQQEEITVLTVHTLHLMRKCTAVGPWKEAARKSPVWGFFFFRPLNIPFKLESFLLKYYKTTCDTFSINHAFSPSLVLKLSLSLSTPSGGTLTVELYSTPTNKSLCSFPQSVSICHAENLPGGQIGCRQKNKKQKPSEFTSWTDCWSNFFPILWWRNVHFPLTGDVFLPFYIGAVE